MKNAIIISTIGCHNKHFCLLFLKLDRKEKEKFIWHVLCSYTKLYAILRPSELKVRYI